MEIVNWEGGGRGKAFVQRRKETGVAEMRNVTCLRARNEKPCCFLAFSSARCSVALKGTKELESGRERRWRDGISFLRERVFQE